MPVRVSTFRYANGEPAMVGDIVRSAGKEGIVVEIRLGRTNFTAGLAVEFGGIRAGYSYHAGHLEFLQRTL